MVSSPRVLQETYRECLEDGDVRPRIEMDADFAGVIRDLSLPCIELTGPEGVHFVDTDLRGADLTGLPRVRLLRCQITGCELSYGAETVDCVADNIFGVVSEGRLASAEKEPSPD